MSDQYIENGHHRYNRNNREDEENYGFDSEPRLQFGIKQLDASDAAKLQAILTVQECLKWDVAFQQFWNNPDKPWRKGLYNPKGFRGLKFGNQGRDKKDNFTDSVQTSNKNQDKHEAPL